MSQQDLFDAAREGKEERIYVLLDQGTVDVRRKDAKQQTALMLAAKNGYRGIVDILYKKGANIDASDENDSTALHLAVKAQHTNVVRYLLNEGANKELTDENGMTPLHWAAKLGNKLFVELLLDYGADPTAIDDGGHTAFTLAEIAGHQAVMKILDDEESSSSESDLVRDDDEAVHSDTDGEEKDYMKKKKEEEEGEEEKAKKENSNQQESSQQRTSSIPAKEEKKPEVPMKILKAHTGSITDLKFSPDGRMLASGSWDKSVKLWDPNTGDLIHNFTLDTVPFCVSFSADSGLLAAGGKDKVMLWFTSSRSLVRMISSAKIGLEQVSFSPDGRFLASGVGDMSIGLWNPNTGDLVRTIALSHRINGLTFSPDGLLFLVRDGMVLSLNPNTGDIVGDFQINHTNYAAERILFSRDGRRFASGQDLWDPNAGVIVKAFRLDGCPVYYSRSTGLAPDGHIFVIVGETEDNNESYVCLWHTETGKHIEAFKGPTTCGRPEFSPNGRLLACRGFRDCGEIYIWELPDRILVGN